MQRFIHLAGGPDADLVVFPTASEEADTGDYYRELFADDYGCRNVAVAEVHDRDDAMDEKLAERVRAADGIWFSGGDQRRITEALLDTPVGTAVVEAWRRGATVGGTSAGTACQSGLMITGDGDFDVITADNVVLWPGLGMFEGVIVDQHFVARRRHNRLISVVLEHPELVGVGVDEGTAVWVRPDGTFRVIGEAWVVVYDATEAEVRRGAFTRDRTALGAHGMRMHVLIDGDVYDVGRRRVLDDDPWLEEEGDGP
jgi:cyanophycinase